MNASANRLNRLTLSDYRSRFDTDTIYIAPDDLSVVVSIVLEDDFLKISVIDKDEEYHLDSFLPDDIKEQNPKIGEIVSILYGENIIRDFHENIYPYHTIYPDIGQKMYEAFLTKDKDIYENVQFTQKGALSIRKDTDRTVEITDINNLYAAIITVDMGNSVDDITVQYLLSKDRPKQKMVSDYFDRSWYRYTKILAVEPANPANDDLSCDVLRVRDPVFWTNDLDLMTKRIAEQPGAEVYRISDRELQRIKDSVKDTSIELEDRHFNRLDRKDKALGMWLQSDEEMEME